MNSAPDYLADYACLGCAPDCGSEALERAWRRAISEAHPDRSRAPDAAERMHQLTTAYRRLRAFEHSHGRLPGRARERIERPAHHPDPAAYPAPTARRRWWLSIPVALAVGGVILLPQHDPSLPASDVAPSALPASATLAGESAAPAALIRLGDRAERVVALAGAPILVAGDVWEYGPSHVRLRAERVIDWYSSPMKPLPVPSERPIRQTGTLIEPPSQK